MRRIGLIVNPVAGVGGAVGLKGSDGEEIQRLAVERGAKRMASAKAELALEEALPLLEQAELYAAPGDMGEALIKSLGLPVRVVGETGNRTTGADTERIAGEMATLPVDLLVFAGGDGTARNVCAAVGENLPALGIPAGVKIHSGVYATSPAAAGKALSACLRGGVAFHSAEVMDLDEERYRAGEVRSRLYGYLTVPSIRNVIQNPKAASRNDPADVAGICHEIQDRMAAEPADCLYLFGAGSTVQRIMESLDRPGTLLGVDALHRGAFLAKDATEQELLELTRGRACRLVITAIGGQGHIFGRGNQQLSPTVIRQVGLDNIWVVAAASKIFSLPSQSLFVDTGDQALNAELRGYRRVTVGWRESLVCRVL